MWLEWLILKKKRLGRQQMGRARRQQLMEFPKRSCANEALPLPSSESCPWGLAYSTPSMVVFVRGPAHGSEKEERTTTD